MYLASNIRYLRKRSGLSQEQLAEKFGYGNFTTVQKWESEKADPPLKIVKGLADLFLVSMDEIVNKDLQSIDENKIMGWEESPSPSSANLTDEAVTIAKAYMRADDGTKSSVAKLLDVKREDSIEMEERKSA